VIVVAFLLVFAALVLRNRHRVQQTAIPAAVERHDTSPTATVAKVLAPPPLPDFLEKPGLVSKRIGPMRVYVALAAEIAATSKQGEALDSVPILITFDNDTYQKQHWPNRTADTQQILFTVSISRQRGQTSETVFTRNMAQSDLNTWEPAQRKTFKLVWPLQSARVGDVYVVSVKIIDGTSLELKSRIV
jgi:hypothetical protein